MKSVQVYLGPLQIRLNLKYVALLDSKRMNIFLTALNNQISISSLVTPSNKEQEIHY